MIKQRAEDIRLMVAKKRQKCIYLLNLRGELMFPKPAIVESDLRQADRLLGLDDARLLGDPIARLWSDPEFLAEIES